MFVIDYLTPSELVAYEQARTIVDVMEELACLRAENLSLQNKLNERDNYIDGLFKQNITHIGDILSTMIAKTEAR